MYAARFNKEMLMLMKVLIIMYSFVSAQPNKTQKCVTFRNNVTYTCQANQMIHVISELYQEASEDCEVPDDACEVKQDTLSNGFITVCNGKVTCTEDLSMFTISKTCVNITAAMATITYECIRDPPINVCSTVAPALGSDTLYLSSPNYPEKSNITDRACKCDITGTDMSVEILEIKFLFPLSVRANLTLTGDISTWESYPNTVLMYNQKVMSKANSLHVTFNANNRHSQRMWIRIIGTSNITVQCNYVQPVMTVTSTTSTDTSAPAPSSATTDVSTTLTTTMSGEIVSQGSQNTSAIIGALSSVIVILLLLVAALVIYFKCVKPHRMLPSNSSERGDEAPYEYVTDIQNDTHNTPDTTPADYADLRHYGNMDNVYTGMSTQGNQTVVRENSYSNVQS